MFDIKEIDGQRTTEVVDEGLRQYMIKVFNYMGLGLCLTALTAYIGANTPLITLMFSVNEANNTAGLSALGWLITLAPLGMIFAFGAMMRRASLSALQAMFRGFSAVMGLSLSSIFIVYTGASLARVFLITAATFGGMSLIGYTTKKDLSGIGSFLYMGLIGIIIASIVNIFMNSSGLGYAISYLSVVIFTGLTAYDMQNIKNMYYASSSEDSSARYAVSGALNLYLDFINLFLSLLRLMGDRR